MSRPEALWNPEPGKAASSASRAPPSTTMLIGRAWSLCQIGKSRLQRPQNS